MSRRLPAVTALPVALTGLLALSGLMAAPADAWPWDEKAAKVDPNAAKKAELAALNGQLQAARDELQELIASRWENKQKYAGQRETDKEALARLREAQERGYMDQSRVKEEVFAREKTIEDERRKAHEAKEAWSVVKLTLSEKLDKEGDKIAGKFPMDVEQRRLRLEKVREVLDKQGELSGLNAYIRYFEHFVGQGTRITIGRHRILPENGSPVDVQLARFGSVFAYAMNEQGDAWVVTQTGRLGDGRFSVNPVAALPLKQHLAGVYPGWLAANEISGLVMADIIQTAMSKNLISGVKPTREDQVRAYLEKGGFTMIPLLALPAWALLIFLYKFIQLSLFNRTRRLLSRKVIRLLEEDDLAGARKVASRRWGAVARVVRTVLDHAERSRESAENAVKEVLLKDVPGLNRHLTTLAVIAAAAPLLGLLGTVTGMITLFEVITNYGTGDPKIMASGISEALITTQTGLVVAIPILLLHNSLRNRKNRLQEEMERNAVTIMNRIWPGDVATNEIEEDVAA